MNLHGLPCRRIANVHADFNWKAWQTYRPTVQEATSPPATGNGNTRRKQHLDAAGPAVSYSNPQSVGGEDVTGSSSVVVAARFMEVRYRVRGLFLTCILFLLESRCPSVRGYPNCGIFINHKDGCKQMTKSRNVRARHQAITTMQGR